MVAQNMTSTTDDIPGSKLVKGLGVVRGSSLYAAGAVSEVTGGLQTLIGGKVSAFQTALDTSRTEASDDMCKKADEAGANAVIGVFYDSNDFIVGNTEVICYGTAVLAMPGG